MPIAALSLSLGAGISKKHMARNFSTPSSGCIRSYVAGGDVLLKVNVVHIHSINFCEKKVQTFHLALRQSIHRNVRPIVSNSIWPDSRCIERCIFKSSLTFRNSWLHFHGYLLLSASKLNNSHIKKYGIDDNILTRSVFMFNTRKSFILTDRLPTYKPKRECSA